MTKLLSFCVAYLSISIIKCCWNSSKSNTFWNTIGGSSKGQIGINTSPSHLSLFRVLVCFAYVTKFLSFALIFFSSEGHLSWSSTPSTDSILSYTIAWTWLLYGESRDPPSSFFHFQQQTQYQNLPWSHQWQQRLSRLFLELYFSLCFEESAFKLIKLSKTNYNLEQNNWIKIKKCSKIGQDYKTLVPTFAYFTVIAKVYFWEVDWR